MPILPKFLDKNDHKMGKNDPGDMKFSENLPKTLIYIVKTKFLKTTTFWGSKMAKNHYLWLRAPGPTPHLWPPKRAIFRFFPDMTPIPQFRPWKILTSLKISEKSNNGINLPPKTLLCAPKSPFQPSYKLFFHTFRPKGPKARRKKAHFTRKFQGKEVQ